MFISTSAFAQYRATIDSLKKVEQSCLDSGRHMPSCVYQFYVQIDSLMNVVYNRLQQLLQTDEKILLKKQQFSWLRKRDIYFKERKEIYMDSIISGAWGSGMRVIPLDEKARFVEKRVFVLIKKLPGKH